MRLHKEIKVGALVRYAWNGAPHQKPAGHGKKVGLVVDDLTMWCTFGDVEPYRMGSLMILWGEDNVERVTYEELELAA